MTAQGKDAGDEGGYAEEYLTYTLGPEEYAIDILKVQEIRGYEAPTTIANAPPFLKGVINLRGTIVPIVDLRIKFGVGTPSTRRSPWSSSSTSARAWSAWWSTASPT
jgi:purine-binding chemotaxis protein CheW